MPMDPLQLARTLRRRDFLASAAGGIGIAALANLLTEAWTRRRYAGY